MPDGLPLRVSTLPTTARASGWRWLWLAVLVVVLDQVTKHVIQASLQPSKCAPTRRSSH